MQLLSSLGETGFLLHEMKQGSPLLLRLPYFPAQLLLLIPLTRVCCSTETLQKLASASVLDCGFPRKSVG